MKKLSRVFKALSDDTRLTILGLMFRHGHLCVCETERILGISQSKASRHLRYLRDSGLLEDKRDGLIINYRLPRNQEKEVSEILAVARRLLADRPIPEAGPLLVELRAAREGS